MLSHQLMISFICSCVLFMNMWNLNTDCIFSCTKINPIYPFLIYQILIIALIESEWVTLISVLEDIKFWNCLFKLAKFKINQKINETLLQFNYIHLNYMPYPKSYPFVPSWMNLIGLDKLEVMFRIYLGHACKHRVWVYEE